MADNMKHEVATSSPLLSPVPEAEQAEQAQIQAQSEELATAEDNEASAPSPSSVQPQPSVTESTPKVPQPSIICRAPSAIGIWLAARPAGQMVFRAADRVLRAEEKTLVWYQQFKLLRRQDVCSEVSCDVISRPLPGLILIPLLLFSLYISFWLWIAFRIDSVMMVQWIQMRRHKLRAIKYGGAKKMHREQARYCPWHKGPVSAFLWFLGFSQSEEQAPISPCIEPHTSEKRKYCEVEQSESTSSSDEEGLHVKLEQFCKDYNSESDPDFHPSSHDDTSDSTINSDAEGAEEVEHKLDGLVSENAAEGKFHRSDSVIPEPPTPVDKDGIAVAGQFAGSPMPLAAVTSIEESKIVRFFVPLVRKMNRGKQGKPSDL